MKSACHVFGRRIRQFQIGVLVVLDLDMLVLQHEDVAGPYEAVEHEFDQTPKIGLIVIRAMSPSTWLVGIDLL